jgi:PhnB protein
MIAINPYLNFAGNTEEAFNFYKSVFGGDFAMVMRFDGMEGSGNMSAEDKQKIMHIALPIKGNMVMGTDALGSMGQQLIPGNNFHLVLGTESKEESDDLYSQLSEGGEETLPMQDMFWGAYYGQLTDRFGIQWMISYDPRFVTQHV